MPPRGKGGAQSAAGRAVASSRPAISREFIAEHKRRRIMDAIAELTSEQGYEATKISDIVRQAKVARKTLYDNFAGKEEVFLAAFDAARDATLERMQASCSEGEADWRDRVEAGLAAFLGCVAERPAVARMCMIEALSATPATTQRYEEALQTFVDLAQEALPRDGRMPETIDETLVGGVAWIVYRKLRSGEGSKAGELLPELAEFVRRPYVEAGLADAAAGRADE